MFVRKLDGTIHFSRHQGGTSWSDWQEIPGGGRTPSAPAMADNVLMVRGTDDDVHYNAVERGTWQGWRRVAGGGRTHSPPAITRFGQGYLAIVRGTDDEIYHQSIGSDFSTSGQWKPVPGHGRTLSGPAVVGSMVVVRGTDNGLYVNSFDGLNTWNGWEQVPGGATLDAPALAHSPGFITLAVRGTDEGIHYNFLG